MDKELLSEGQFITLGAGVFPILAHTGRLRLTGVPFPDFGYING